MEFDLKSKIVFFIKLGGEKLFVNLCNNTMGMLDILYSKFILLKKCHSNSIVSAAFSTSVSYLITLGNDNRIMIWN